MTPRASIFDLATPAVVDGGDTDSVVLGVKFRADVAGTITGIRFYKAAGNTGTHVGSAVGVGRRVAAGPGDVHERDRLGLADRHVRDARSR